MNNSITPIIDLMQGYTFIHLMLVPWARHWLLPAVSSLGKAAAALVGDAAPRLNSQRKHVVLVLLLGLHGLQPILGRDPDATKRISLRFLSRATMPGLLCWILTSVLIRVSVGIVALDRTPSHT